MKMFSGASVQESTFRREVDLHERYRARALELNEEGLQLFFKGSTEAGIGKLKQALGHDPNNSTILYNLAGFFLAEKKPKPAIGLMQRAIRFDPDDLSFHTRIAEAYLLDGQLGGAIDAYKRVVQVDPSYNRSIVKLGTLYAMDDRHKEAVSTLRQAHELFGEDPDVLSTLGNALMMEGKHKDAIPIIKRCQKMEHSPDNEVALGVAYESLGEPDKALRHYRNAVDLGDGDQELHRKIAELEAVRRTLPQQEENQAHQ